MAIIREALFPWESETTLHLPHDVYILSVLHAGGISYTATDGYRTLAYTFRWFRTGDEVPQGWRHVGSIEVDGAYPPLAKMAHLYEHVQTGSTGFGYVKEVDPIAGEKKE